MFVRTFQGRSLFSLSCSAPRGNSTHPAPLWHCRYLSPDIVHWIWSVQSSPTCLTGWQTPTNWVWPSLQAQCPSKQYSFWLQSSAWTQGPCIVDAKPEDVQEIKKIRSGGIADRINMLAVNSPFWPLASSLFPPICRRCLLRSLAPIKSAQGSVWLTDWLTAYAISSTQTDYYYSCCWRKLVGLLCISLFGCWPWKSGLFFIPLLSSPEHACVPIQERKSERTRAKLSMCTHYTERWSSRELESAFHWQTELHAVKEKAVKFFSVKFWLSSEFSFSLLQEEIWYLPASSSSSCLLFNLQGDFFFPSANMRVLSCIYVFCGLFAANIDWNLVQDRSEVAICYCTSVSEWEAIETPNFRRTESSVSFFFRGSYSFELGGCEMVGRTL